MAEGRRPPDLLSCLLWWKDTFRLISLGFLLYKPADRAFLPLTGAAGDDKRRPERGAAFLRSGAMEVLPEGNGPRRTLAEQLAATPAQENSSSSSPSPNLRDLLKRTQEEINPRHHLSQRSFSRRISLATFLAGEKRDLSERREAALSPATARTLTDIIRDEDDSAVDGGGSTASPIPPPPRPAEQAPPSRVSLMALLEEADRHSVASAVFEEVEDEAGEGRRGEKGTRCCVCMVREKGAAFIPCGHTFCRICSRELWISRRTCPLCNALIHEILDIF